MIAIERFNNLYERLHGFQVAALDRDVGRRSALVSLATCRWTYRSGASSRRAAMTESISRLIVRTLTLRASAICSRL